MMFEHCVAVDAPRMTTVCYVAFELVKAQFICFVEGLTFYITHYRSETIFPVNHLAGTSKTEPNYNQIQLTTQKS